MERIYAQASHTLDGTGGGDRSQYAGLLQMTLLGVGKPRAAAGCADSNVIVWKTAVVTAGGTVSPGQETTSVGDWAVPQLGASRTKAGSRAT